jgi:hypothetical protein
MMIMTIGISTVVTNRFGLIFLAGILALPLDCLWRSAATSGVGRNKPGIVKTFS